GDPKVFLKTRSLDPNGECRRVDFFPSRAPDAVADSEDAGALANAVPSIPASAPSFPGVTVNCRDCHRCRERARHAFGITVAFRRRKRGSIALHSHASWSGTPRASYADSWIVMLFDGV